MSALIAKRPLRFRSKDYNIGDVLPVDDPVWTASWLDAGSAVWGDPPEPEAPRPTAGLIAEPIREIQTQQGAEQADKLPKAVERVRKGGRRRKTQ